MKAPSNTARWRVRVLGAFEVDDGQQPAPLRSRAAIALLARVAMAPGREHPRESLVAMLWPDADGSTGRNRLRQTLSSLKSLLEPAGSPAVLLADRRAVRAVPGALWCDAVAFEAAQRAGDHTLAASLYGGELLPGFYEEWVNEERQRLAALHDTVVAARSAAPPAATRRPPSRLPHYLTRLIGADAQREALQARVRVERLVTVLGAGGSGKTRLAVEAAHALCDDAADTPFERAVFVSLVGVDSDTGLLDRLRAALRIESAGDAVEQITDTLDGRRLLLLLDNCEQLGDAASACVARLAERLPLLHWLLSSRRPLGLDGEHLLALHPLEPPTAGASAAEVARNAAVQLFVDRARAQQADFKVDDGNHQALSALVAWLEGLPLAIELAASQVRTLQPAPLLALLRSARAQAYAGAGNSSLVLLARRGPRSGNDPRHTSMQDVVGWTWQLLGPEQQQLLLALCLLPAGATLAVAAAVMGQPPAHAQVLLHGLSEQSVLRTQQGQDGQWRHLPHEPVREYVLAHHVNATLRPHRARVLAALLAWAQAMPATPPLPEVREELPNIAQALAHAPACGLADDAVMLVLLLQSSWGEMAVPTGVLDTLDTLLGSAGLDSSRAACGHALAASFCHEASRLDDARRHMQQALALPCPNDTLRVTLLARLARLRWRVQRDAAGARELLEQALPLARAQNKPNAEASMLSLKGHLLTVVDRDPAQGAVLTQQALALWQRSGNRHLINAGRYNLAVTTIRAGRPADVLDELAALAAEGRELQDWDLASGALEARGTALLALRRWPEAWASLRQALVVGWDGMEILATVYALWNVAPVLARLRHAELAAATMAAADVQWRRRFGEPDPGDLRDLKRMQRFVRVLLGTPAAQAAWQRGAAQSLGEAVQAVLQAPVGA